MVHALISRSTESILEPPRSELASCSHTESDGSVAVSQDQFHVTRSFRAIRWDLSSHRFGDQRKRYARPTMDLYPALSHAQDLTPDSFGADVDETCNKIFEACKGFGTNEE